MADVSIFGSRMGALGGKPVPQKELPHIVAELPAAPGKITQRKIVYYSDFEINLTEWRAEYECLQTYAKSLRKSLGMEKMNEGCRRGLGVETERRALQSDRGRESRSARQERLGRGPRVPPTHRKH